MQQDSARHGLVGLLKRCAKQKDLHRGNTIYAELVRMGLLEKDAFAGSALVSMYAKCGSLERAQEVFDKISTHNVILWNSLIAGYAQNGHGIEALKFFQQMQLEGTSPDAVTFVCILRACGSIGATDKGHEIHAAIITRGGLLEQDVFIGTGLVDMYCKCGLLMKAQTVLHQLPVRNVVSWNALIAGFVQHGHYREALISCECMQVDGIIPDAVTFVCTLKACAKTRAASKGQELHAEIVREGWLKKNVIVGISLVDMYAKCSLLVQAQDVFDGLSVHNVALWNSLIAGYTQCGYGEEALHCFKRMQLEGLSPNTITFVCILKACGSVGAAIKGQEIHVDIVREGLGQHVAILTALVEMYAKCGLLGKAHELVDNLLAHDIVAWSMLIAGYTQHGLDEKALNCFEQMRLKGLSPDAATFVYILKACGKLRASVKGQDIHSEIVKKEGLLETNIYVGSALVDMYANCGLLGRAQEVFDELPFRNVVLWSALIAGYAQQGRGEKALECFELMQQDGISPNAVTFVCVLKACGSIGAVDKGQELHAEVVRGGLLEKNIVVSNALVDMYVKSGLLVKAQEVFDKLPIRNVVTWSALITGYAQHGQGKEALCLFEQMGLEGFSPNEVTFIGILKACGSIEDAVKGREIHIMIAREGLLENHVTLGTALVDMYSKCGLLANAQEVFDSLPVRDVVLWNVLIWGYTLHGHDEFALSCFKCMQLEGTSPDTATLVCILKACGSIGALDRGKEIHAEIIREGLDRDAGVCTALIDMYAKCGLVAKARELFDKLGARDVASWSALIVGYAQYGHSEEALNCYERMQLEGIFPDAVTFACVLKACGSIGATQKGEEIHAEVLEEGMLEKDIVVGTALLSMYARCGFFVKAQEVFDQLPMRNVVSWSALIAGYAQHCYGDKALHSFEQMQLERISPNAITIVCVLKACGSIGAADRGEDIHAEIVKEGFLEKHIAVGNALVDMYVKCGLLAKAQEVFDNLPQRNAVSWSTLIAGYAHLGKVDNVFDLFDKMIGACVKPDLHTLTSVLHSCSHTGLLDKGQKYFEKMSTHYGLIPTLEHHNCLADLFGRAGHIDKAIAVIQEMPFSANTIAWHNVLGACRKWGNIELGRVAFEHAVQLDENDAAAYICMSSMYLGAGRLEEAEKVEAMRVRNKAWQTPGLCLMQADAVQSLDLPAW